MAIPLVEAVNLKQYFKVKAGTVHAVDDVSLTINEGETLGVVGESGCGKSTLGRTIIRLLEPTAGEVKFKGQSILPLRGGELKKMRTNMQMIFQDPYSSLNPRLSVSELIAEPLKVTKIVNGATQREEKVLEAMELCGLPERYFNTFPHEMDGGRRQRVGLARALVLNPKFIVCDEPVSALDVSIQAQILNLLMDLREEKNLSYMFITHDLCVVRHISDNIMVMYMGQVVEYAERKELFAKQAHPYTRALLSAIPTTDFAKRNKKREIIQGEVANLVDPKPGCRFAPRCPHAAEQCSQDQPLREVSPGHYVACCLYDS